MVSTWYAMREALAIVAAEGLPLLWARHATMGERLWNGLTALGLEPYAAPGDGLVTVNTIKVPPGVDWASVTATAMADYHLEIAGGLGPTAGSVWRVGVMGYNACPEAVDLVVAAFRAALKA
jgi:alanine-glyoxylate transaminase/serine-glyoxylate transaminase/serine-pyruvate transaminase